MADAAVGKDKCGDQRLVSLPLSRIRVIMKSSPEVSSINQEALVLTAKATVSGRRRGGARGGCGALTAPRAPHTPGLAAALWGAARLSLLGLRLRAPHVSRPPPPAVLSSHPTPHCGLSHAHAACPLGRFRSEGPPGSQRPSRPAHRVIPALPRARASRRPGCGCAKEAWAAAGSASFRLKGAVADLPRSDAGRFSKLPGYPAGLSRPSPALRASAGCQDLCRQQLVPSERLQKQVITAQPPSQHRWLCMSILIYISGEISSVFPCPGTL